MSLRLEKPILYGASTGAAIVHAFGSQYPNDAQLVMLDTFSHHVTDDYIDGYMPDLRPTRDGSHLLRAWDSIVGLFLFAPWQKAEAGRRQVRALPPAEVLHDMTMQLLQADPAYGELYLSAIAWEDKDHLSMISAPTTLNVWEGASGIDRVKLLIELGLPDNITSICSPAGPGGRYREQLRYLLEHGFDNGNFEYRDAPPPDTAADFLRYIEVEGYQIHARHSPGGSGKPVILLHDRGKSLHQFDPWFTEIAKDRPVVALDLPGHGYSANLAGEGQIPQVLAQACAALGYTDVHLIAAGGSVFMASAFADSCTATTHCLFSANPLTTPINRPELACYESGAQFVAAHWKVHRQAVFWGDEATAEAALARLDPFNPDRLHQETVDLLRSVEAKHYDTKQGLPSLTGKILVPDWRVGGEPLTDRVPSDWADNTLSLPGAESDWARVIADMLDQQL